MARENDIAQPLPCNSLQIKFGDCYILFEQQPTIRNQRLYISSIIKIDFLTETILFALVGGGTLEIKYSAVNYPILVDFATFVFYVENWIKNCACCGSGTADLGFVSQEIIGDGIQGTFVIPHTFSDLVPYSDVVALKINAGQYEEVEVGGITYTGNTITILFSIAPADGAIYLCQFIFKQ
jgi:hypothetical protein